MGPWKCFRALCLCHSHPPKSDDDNELLTLGDKNRSKVVMRFPDQYHVLKISDENELFFYKFIPWELRKFVPQACAIITPERDTPRLLPFACLGSIDKRGHHDEFDYERRNGAMPNTGKTLLVMRDIKADMVSPQWVDFELGIDNMNCFRLSGMSLNTFKRRIMKSELREMSISQIKNMLETVLHDYLDIIDLIIEEMDKVIEALCRVSGISFQGTSIYIAFDAASLPSSHFRVAVKLMSFGEVKLSSEGSLYVLNGMITLREILRSIRKNKFDLM
ncbi:hypothetical protein PRIPAC_95353 [Pristionchus pacificus]|uniref:Uncharacterized protein n=1 Tax=Pristionchus pacificus TaxID=54126 RepID=A0A2A6CTX3_PRIPA|nr:hypothetical protein PRIPAC_95353 [Pristionchus pacificus]|eukprot:PDM81599.1 hypothetical protein PRIPAC_30580 [Pristionchus pacificus]